MRDFLATWKRYFVFAALLSCFINILQLTFPFYMFAIYRNIIVSYSLPSLYTITVAAVYALIVLFFFNYLRSRLLAAAGKDLNLCLRDNIYIGMLKGFAGLKRQGYRQGLNDLETVRNYFTNNGLYALFDAPWAPLYLLLIYFFHPVLGIIATAGAVVMFILSLLQEFLVRNRMRRANQKNIQNQRLVDASLRNADVINGMGMIKSISDRFEQENKEVILDQTISSRHAGSIQSTIKPMQNVLQILIYGSGAYFAMTEGFSVGLMVAAAIIMGRALAPLMQVMSAWKFTLQARDAYHRLDAFLTTMENQPLKMSLPQPKGKISVSNATLRLQDSFLLKNISFELNPGDFLGVVGPSGAGKTTLCRLILGIWPSMGGKVRLDDMDIFCWDQEEIGPYIGYLPQEVELFPGTVAQNIARMGPVDENKVQQSCQLSGIDQIIKELPQGYETQLEGQGGLTLSGGQKQRLGLARALYNDPKLIVLDEPNSNLDEQGEQDLLQALKAIKDRNNSTCIMVTHKPDLLNSMDKILILKNGQVSTFGPKDQVFSKLMQQPQTPAKGKMQVIRS